MQGVLSKEIWYFSIALDGNVGDISAQVGLDFRTKEFRSCGTHHPASISSCRTARQVYNKVAVQLGKYKILRALGKYRPRSKWELFRRKKIVWAGTISVRGPRICSGTYDLKDNMSKCYSILRPQVKCLKPLTVSMTLCCRHGHHAGHILCVVLITTTRCRCNPTYPEPPPHTRNWLLTYFK